MEEMRNALERERVAQSELDPRQVRNGLPEVCPENMRILVLLFDHKLTRFRGANVRHRAMARVARATWAGNCSPADNARSVAHRTGNLRSGGVWFGSVRRSVAQN